jgi:hypothetical protein
VLSIACSSRNSPLPVGGTCVPSVVPLGPGGPAVQVLFPVQDVAA